jgi:hypothetical protein
VDNVSLNHFDEMNMFKKVEDFFLAFPKEAVLTRVKARGEENNFVEKYRV